jgi:uncharacterized membrane protein YkvA (DUF1232 family)
MKDFDQLLKEDIAAYAGPRADLLAQAPAFFRLLARMLADPALPGRLRPLIMAAIGYFALAADIMPEDLRGSFGYIDDLFLAAFVANQVRLELDSDGILLDNWDGEKQILPLIEEILSLESELLEDKKDLVLWYIGYEHMAK